MNFMLFLHYVGSAMWFGGMVAGMVVIAGAPRDERGGNPGYHILARLYSLVVGPGALVAVLSGLALTMLLAQRAGSAAMARPGIWIMQVAGLIAGVLTLAVAMPTANTLSRMLGDGEGALPSGYEKLRKRLASVIHVVAVCVTGSFFVVVMVR